MRAFASTTGVLVQSQENAFAGEPFGGDRGITRTLNTPQHDQRDLIDRARAGEAIAFERLARQHAARLWRCALALGNDSHWAEGSCPRNAHRSLAMLAAFRRPLPVLHLAIRHSAAPVLEGTPTCRRRQAVAARCHGPSSRHRPAPDCSAEASEDAQRVRRAVASLADEHRLVVEMRFFAGATLDEIAAALGCPLGTVKSRLHYALAKLRQMNLAVNLFTSPGESQERKNLSQKSPLPPGEG